MVDERFLLSFRHVRLVKDGVWIPIRRPLNMKILRKIDERIKPDLMYYTQGRFFRPHELRDRREKKSFFLYQDVIIVDMDDYTKEELERMADKALYVMFTGRGYHFCYMRRRFPDEEVDDPELREAIVAKNNLNMLKEIAEERGVNVDHVDVLPEPRQFFKVPLILKYANRKAYNGAPLRVWWEAEGFNPMIASDAENKADGSKVRGEGGAPDQASLGPSAPIVPIWDNVVQGTRGYVLFCKVSRSRAQKMAEEYNLRSAFYMNDYLIDVKVIDKYRLMKILRRESHDTLKSFLKYKRIVGVLGRPEPIRVEEEKGRSRGHCRYINLFFRIEGDIGRKEVKMGIARVGKNA